MTSKQYTKAIVEMAVYLLLFLFMGWKVTLAAFLIHFAWNVWRAWDGSLH